MLIRPVIRPLIRPLVRLPTERGAGSIEAAVRRIFASGVDGYWRDPSDLSTSFQDSAGTTAGAVDSAVGLMLDKSDGAVRGAELVTTPSFVGSGSAVSGAIAPALTVNRTYEVSFTVSGYSGTGDVGFDGTVFTSSASTRISGNGTVRGVAVALGGAITQVFTRATNAATFSNISIREIPGNHTTQSTGGSRPLLKLVSGYYGDQFDGLDDYVVSTSGGGGSAGFFYCGAVYVGGGAASNRTVWSDRGTFSGYEVRVSGSDTLMLVAGDGAALTLLSAAVNSMTVGTTTIATAWDDGVNLNVQVNGGAVASVARPTVSAGTAGFTEGRANGTASTHLTGRLGTRVYFKGYCPDAATREQIKRYIAIRSGVSL